MLLNSKRVKIDGLGIFYTTLENEKGGADKKEDFSPTKNLKALHIRFLPDQEAETNISSREFIKKAEFVNAEALASQPGSESGGEIEDPDNTDNGQTGGSQNQTGSGNTSGGNSGSNTGSNTGGDNTGHGSGDMN